jgi:hypothetical protein
LLDKLPKKLGDLEKLLSQVNQKIDIYKNAFIQEEQTNKSIF